MAKESELVEFVVLTNGARYQEKPLVKGQHFWASATDDQLKAALRFNQVELADKTPVKPSKPSDTKPPSGTTS